MTFWSPDPVEGSQGKAGTIRAEVGPSISNIGMEDCCPEGGTDETIGGLDESWKAGAGAVAVGIGCPEFGSIRVWE